jgi:hypothetical protein
MYSPAPEKREQDILSLWERAAGLSRWDREDALLAAIGKPTAMLGARNAALLSLRGALFGRAWSLQSRCPQCSTDCEFEADSIALSDALSALPAPVAHTAIEIFGRSIELRAPTADDLRSLADRGEGAAALLSRCVIAGMDASDAAAEILDKVDAVLERLDPGAVVAFALECPACGHRWQAAVDVGDAIWSELQHAAERSLLEVDALARAYGWTESEVLRLSPIKRAAYLQLTGA